MSNGLKIYKGFMIHAIYQRVWTEIWSFETSPAVEHLQDRLEEDEAAMTFMGLLVQPEGRYGLNGFRCGTLKEAMAWIDSQTATA